MYIYIFSKIDALFSSDDEELFEDAMDNEEVHFMVSKPPGHRRTSSEESSAAR